MCVDGMAGDILSKDNFLRVRMTSRQHLPITVITIQEKKVLLQWAFYDNLTQKHQ